jgi:hypothetical protein
MMPAFATYMLEVLSREVRQHKIVQHWQNGRHIGHWNRIEGHKCAKITGYSHVNKCG